MPQVFDRNSAPEPLPMGQGSLFYHLMDISWSTSKRAAKLNKAETRNLKSREEKLSRAASRTQRFQEALIHKYTEQMRNTIALNKIISERYRGFDFDTLEFGYRERDARKDPWRNQRWVNETKIYHSGWNKHNLRREVKQTLIEIQPKNIKEESRLRKSDSHRKRIMTYDVTSDRNMTLTPTLEHFKKTKREHELRLRFRDRKVQVANRSFIRDITKLGGDI